MGADGGIQFREMTQADLPRVIEIIEAAEPDDAKEAYSDIKRDLTDRFVMTLGGEVFGLTGYREVPDTDRSFWLSWTGVDPEAVSGEVGEALITWVVGTLRDHGGRKLFTMIADGDIAPGAGTQRGRARIFYEGLGFGVEARHREYYDRGDDATVLGYRLVPAGAPPSGIVDPGPVSVLDSDEIPETDDAYYLDWDFAGKSPPATPADLEAWIARIEKWGGRVAFIGLPSHANAGIGQLTAAGFREDGRLKDLIEDGIDEVRLRYDF